HPNESVDVKVKRGDEVIDKQVFVKKEGPDALGYMGILPILDVVVGGLTKDKPAEKAGLKVNDVIKSINGKTIQEPADVVKLIQESKGNPVTVVASRTEAGKSVLHTFTIKPELYSETDFWDRMFKKSKQPESQRWILGFMPVEPTVREAMTFPDALKGSID